MATRIPDAVRNAIVDLVVDRLDAGAGVGTVEIRSGSQPADADDAETGTLLAEVPLNDPAFGAASGGSAAADVAPALATTGLAAGTAGWFRAKDSNSVTVLDGSVTATGGGGDMELNTTTISIGVDVEITSWNVSITGG
jgi:hypothetical protein